MLFWTHPSLTLLTRLCERAARSRGLLRERACILRDNWLSSPPSAKTNAGLHTREQGKHPSSGYTG